MATTEQTPGAPVRSKRPVPHTANDKLILGALVGNIASLPFDVAAVRQQLGNSKPLFELIADMWEEAGEYDLWAGLIPASLISTIQLYLQSRFMKLFVSRLSPEVDDRSDEKPPVPPMRPLNSFMIDTIAAGLAGATVSLITMPLHSVKLVLQIPHHLLLPSYSYGSEQFELMNAWEGLNNILYVAGTGGLFSYFTTHLLGSFLFASGTFAAYNKLKQIRLSMIAREELAKRLKLQHRGVLVTQFLMSIIVGALAGSFLSVPFDNIRVAGFTALMRGVRVSPFQVISSIWRQDGVLGFFKGFISKCLKGTIFGCASYLTVMCLDILPSESDE